MDARFRTDLLAVQQTRGSTLTARLRRRSPAAATLARRGPSRLCLISSSGLSAPRLLREPRPLRAPPLALVALARGEVDRPVAPLAGLVGRFLQPAEELVQREVVADRVLRGRSVVSAVQGR